MAFPSTSTTSLESQWQQIKDAAGNVKTKVTAFLAASSLGRFQALDLLNRIADALVTFDTYAPTAATSGLLAYARAQENNPSLDLVAEYNTMRSALVSTQTWFVNNFPKNAASELCVFAIDGNNRYADIPLTAGQLTAFKNQLNTLAPTIA